jgi:hypothetical protein
VKEPGDDPEDWRMCKSPVDWAHRQDGLDAAVISNGQPLFLRQVGSFCFLFALMNSAVVDDVNQIDVKTWISALESLFPNHPFKTKGCSGQQLWELLVHAEEIGMLKSFQFFRTSRRRDDLGFFHFMRRRARTTREAAHTSSWILVGVAPSSTTREKTIRRMEKHWRRLEGRAQQVHPREMLESGEAEDTAVACAEVASNCLQFLAYFLELPDEYADWASFRSKPCAQVAGQRLEKRMERDGADCAHGESDIGTHHAVQVSFLEGGIMQLRDPGRKVLHTLNPKEGFPEVRKFLHSLVTVTEVWYSRIEL